MSVHPVLLWNVTLIPRKVHETHYWRIKTSRLSHSTLIWGTTWWEPLYLSNIIPCISLGAHHTSWLWTPSSNYIGINDYLGKRGGPSSGIIWVTMTIQCVSILMFLTINRECSCWNVSWRSGLSPAKHKLRRNYSSLCSTIEEPPRICIQGVLDGFGYVLCAACVCFVCFFYMYTCVIFYHIINIFWHFLHKLGTVIVLLLSLLGSIILYMKRHDRKSRQALMLCWT